MAIRITSTIVLFVLLACRAVGEPWQAPALPTSDDMRLAGIWAAAQSRNAERMAQPPLDDPDFILADLSLQEIPGRRFTEYSGDISGRWIGAAAFLSALYPEPFAAFPTILAKAPTYQKPDGHFGAEQNLPTIVHDRDIAILWGNGRILVGLIEVYERMGDRESLETAKKIGDYLIATDAVLNNPELMVRKPGSYWLNWETYNLQCVEGLVALARVAEDARYLDEAKRIAALAAAVKDFDHIHSHGRLCALRGIADLYAATGDAHWLDVVEADWATFMQKYRLPSAGVKEVLEPECNRDEGCAECDWLRLNLSLWRLTGKGRYLDEAERCLKNHFIFQQFPNGGAGHRLFHQIDGQPVAFTGPIEEAWWCCSEHWARATVDIARFAVTADSNGLSVNLMIDCEGVVAGPGGNWRVKMRETAEGLQIATEPFVPTQATVRIHRPAWASDATITKPATISLSETEHAWLLDGEWSGEQTIELHLPMAVRIEKTSDGGVALLRGHDLLAAHRTPTNAWLFDKPPAIRPVLRWSDARETEAGRVIVPASLTTPSSANGSESWKDLELAPLRAVVGQSHEWAWFSFQLLPAASENN